MAELPKSIKMYAEFDEDDPRFQVILLSKRIDQMEINHQRELKEHDEERKEFLELKQDMANINRTYQRGIGVAAAILAFGAFIGFLFANGKVIFSPWAKS